jgi:hypothetical protein
VIYLFYAFLIYLAYQFIFKLVIPVYRTSTRIKKGFREMNERMQEKANSPQPGEWQPTRKPEPSSKEKAGEYIDFEEVK